eukprot:TRINITY_DN54196_c0_g1_i1.p2 TRINITY_DN54196_c0_g1~~TRINITY_DN54196_c0_g1_i1.p2  ORF type:complete len:181 (+),score=56.31 TRINITY_DN54196_c0_g1_i1:36-578(+)
MQVLQQAIAACGQVPFHGDPRTELAARCDDATGQDDHADAQRRAFANPCAELVALAVDDLAIDMHGDRRAVEAVIACAYESAKICVVVDAAVTDEALRTDADPLADHGVLEFAGKADAGAIADTQRTTQQRMIADQTVASDQHRTLDVGAVADAAADADTHRAAYRGLWRYVRAWIEVGL